jgi:tRNA dimethylallyltransferase
MAGGTGLYLNAVLFGFDFNSRETKTHANVDFTILNMPRDILYARINARMAAMFDGGLLDEVRQLNAAGYTTAHAPMRAIGYKQAAQVISGDIPLHTAIDNAAKATRNYAKRQLTWLRHQLRDITPRTIDVTGKSAEQIAREVIQNA